MKFKVEIDCGNAAFDGDPGTEVSRILEDLARRVGDHMPVINDKFVLYDINGNKVGFATTVR
jgi:hypothetical protein